MLLRPKRPLALGMRRTTWANPGRNHNAGRAVKKPAPEMNVTPLVDVVLVLLIIFMIVIPGMEHSARLDLPNVAHADAEPQGRLDPITVSMTAAGVLYLEQDITPEPNLIPALRTLHQAAPTRRLVLRGDRTLHYGQLRRLYVLCQRLGFSGISLRVSESQNTP